MRVLVTGGAGFIGSHVAEAFTSRGDEVRVLDDLSTGRQANLAHLSPAPVLARGDVRDARAVAEAVAGCQAVVHLAALISVPASVLDPAATLDVNVTGTARVLAEARRAGVTRFVLASSCSVLGEAPPDRGQREDDPTSPASPYAVSKLAGEHLVRLAGSDHAMTSLSLRFFNVYGPRQDPASPYAAVIPRFARALAAGEAPVLFGDGGQVRDFVHVTDVARAVLAALEAPASAAGAVVHVGTGRATSLVELLALLGEVIPAPLTRAPARHEPARAGDIRRSLADVTRARSLLNFTARVPLPDGLRSTFGA